MSEIKEIYVKCIRDHIMHDGKRTHIKDVIYPARRVDGTYFVTSYRSGSVDHEFGRGDYFHDFFQPVELEITEIKEPRKERTVEDYMEILEGFKKHSYHTPSIEFFADGSGDVRIDEGIPRAAGYTLDKGYSEYTFNDLEELDEILAKIDKAIRG